MQYNTHAPWRATSTIQTNGDHHHLSFGYQSCTWSCSDSLCWQNPCSGCNSGIDLVVFLNILSFNFVPTPNTFLRLRRFRKIYVNCPDDVLTSHISYTASLLDMRCDIQYGQIPFFCSCFPPVLVHLRNLFLSSTAVARMLLTRRWVSRRKDVKQLSINLSKLTAGVKHSINCRTTFSPNPHLVEEATCFHLDMIRNELNSRCFCNRKLNFIFLMNRLVIYSLPTAMSSLSRNHTMDLFYLLKKNFKNLLFDLLIMGKSFENLSYLSSCLLSQRWRFRRIRSNLLRNIGSDLAYTKVSWVAFQYILRSGSL